MQRMEQMFGMSVEEMQNLGAEDKAALRARMMARSQQLRTPPEADALPMRHAPARGFPDGSTPLPVAADYSTVLVVTEPVDRELLLVVADLARRDAELSHRGDGIQGARFVAAMGAAIPAADSLESAALRALALIPETSGAASAIRLGMGLAGDIGGDAVIRNEYSGMSPVHTLNNLAIVVWSLLSHPDDFSAAIGDAVAAGLDTDCNGATVGGLWGMQGKPIPARWSAPWQGRVGVSLAGLAELRLEDLVDRTLSVAGNLVK